MQISNYTADLNEYLLNPSLTILVGLHEGVNIMQENKDLNKIVLISWNKIHFLMVFLIS